MTVGIFGKRGAKISMTCFVNSEQGPALSRRESPFGSFTATLSSESFFSRPRPLAGSARKHIRRVALRLSGAKELAAAAAYPLRSGCSVYFVS